MSGSDDLTLVSLFEKTLRRFPDRVIQVSEEGTRQTYREMNERANRLANGLLGLGLKKGDHVAIYASNCLEYMECILATAKAGMVHVCLNFLWPKERIAYQLDQSDSKAVIFESPFLGSVKHCRENSSKLEHFVMIERGTSGESDRMLSYENLIDQSPNTRPEVEVRSSDGCSLIFTTGTTGVPKAVLRSHLGDLHAPISFIHYFSYIDSVHKLGFPPYHHLVFLLMGPQFHVAGKCLTLVPLISPNTTVVMRTAKFDPEKFLRLIHQEKATSAWVQPAMLHEIKRLPEETVKKYDVSSIIVIICGATGLKEQEKKDMLAFFPNARLGSTYASTEHGLAAYVSGDELNVTKPNNLGMPLWDCDMKVGDEAGNELPPNTIGTIWTKTPALPINSKYYNDPENTRKAFKDGWVSVGDLGWMDEKGYFYYYGRADDIIMTGGEKVSPVPIEETLHQHPKVSVAAVFGVPDPKWQEAVTAVVVLKPGESASEEELIAHCRGKVASYEVPKKVIFAEGLPVGLTGKVDRLTLKGKYGTSS